jgi:UPF0755 protein
MITGNPDEKEDIRKRKFVKKVFMLVGALIAILFLVLFSRFYKTLYRGNVDLHGKDEVFVYIPSHSDFSKVCSILYNGGYIKDKESFEWLAGKKNYISKVKPGKYMLRKGMSNKQLIDMLRAGRQTPVKLTYNNIRTKNELITKICTQLEADSSELTNLLNYNKYLGKFGLNADNCLVMFIPNTYEFYWNTSAEEFMERIFKEYKKFWNADRLKKAKNCGLDKIQVSILASVVQAEQTQYNKEKPVIAGLYINRLRKGMLLQSDPTVIFAIGNFNIHRVLNHDKEINSPYNTYKFAGLPPGPINLPEMSSIDAVLDYEENDFIYMCAKEDLSGFHNFSRTIEQHTIYARKYQQALDAKNIKR